MFASHARHALFVIALLYLPGRQYMHWYTVESVTRTSSRAIIRHIRIIPINRLSFILYEDVSYLHYTNSYPVEHTQDESEALPAGDLACVSHLVQLTIFPVTTEYVSGEQSEHTVFPCAVLNFPDPHGAHVSVIVRTVPVYPALHMHEVTKVLA